MKAIMLAAGIPLAMLDINGKSLLQRNVETPGKSRLYDISVIRGYKRDSFDVQGVGYFDNPKFSSEHILEQRRSSIDA